MASSWPVDHHFATIPPNFIVRYAVPRPRPVFIWPPGTYIPIVPIYYTSVLPVYLVHCIPVHNGFIQPTTQEPRPMAQPQTPQNTDRPNRKSSVEYGSQTFASNASPNVDPISQNGTSDKKSSSTTNSEENLPGFCYPRYCSRHQPTKKERENLVFQKELYDSFRKFIIEYEKLRQIYQIINSPENIYGLIFIQKDEVL